MKTLRQILDLPVPVRLTVLFYLAHLLCEPWIGTSEAFLILAIISWMVALRRAHLQPVWTVIYLPLGLYVIGSAVAALFAPDPFFSILEVSEAILFLIVPLSLSLYRRFLDLREVVWRLLVFIVTFSSVWALVQFFVLGWTDLDHRIKGPASHVMTFSGMVLVISMLMLARVVWERKKELAVPLAVVVLALALTYTRGAWIGWIAGASWIVLSRKPRVAVFAVPVLVIVLLLAPLPWFGRLTSVFDPTVSSNLDRIRMSQAGIEMIRDRPVFGIGPGNIEEVYPIYRLPDAPRFRTPHLHNNPIQIWADRGVLAFGAYHLLFIIIAVELWKRRAADRAAADGGLAATIALFVAGLTEYNFGDAEVLMTWLDGLSLMLAALILDPAAAGRLDASAN